MRLFFSLPVPEVPRAHLAAALESRIPDQRVDHLRITAPTRWHVTLTFCGDMPADAAHRLVEACTSAAFPVAGHRSEIRLAGGGRFGRGVGWVGVEAGLWLPQLAAEVSRFARRHGCPPGRSRPHRHWRPHVTVARSRSTSETGIGSWFATALADYRGPGWLPTSVHLVHSVLGPAPTHTVLAEVQFPSAASVSSP